MSPRQTFALSCDLTGEAHETVWAIWRRLEERFGLRAAQAALRPHITFVVGEGNEPETLIAALGEAVQALAPLTVEINGVATFGKEVIYLRVERTAAIEKTHHRLTSVCDGTGLETWPHYRPEAWIPHVTLALQDLPPNLLPQVLKEVKTYPVRHTTKLTALDLVHVTPPRHRYLKQFALHAASSENR